MALTIDLSGRVAVVTGAGKGIGRAICLSLAEAGATVVAVSRTEPDLDSLGGEVRARGGRYHPVVAELAGEIVAERVAQATIGAFDAIDILINNAGVARNAPAEAVTEEDWDATMSTNLRGAFFMAQAAGRHMLVRRQGRIINVTSQSALVALHEHAAYCASKAALGMLTKVLALEWGPRGVTVNAVAPTVILTPLGERVWGDPAKGGPMLARIPVGRFGVPADVAGVVTFLASDHASLINGETIAIDGGYTAH
ncbi:MAG: glucose 1-dehydrogenase [Chloroflexi bacterium]|nr:glucose 1-dehydrogenase [Chloroflexota bacterium]